jgi:hypothetical protein
MRRIERLGPLESPIFAMNLSFEWIFFKLVVVCGSFLTTFAGDIRMPKIDQTLSERLVTLTLSSRDGNLSPSYLQD